jgi:hypothetical protein
MSRRCKKGQRARIIGKSADVGKIVFVVRPYFYPQKVGDASWPKGLFPWVVTSLGGPLRCVELGSGKECPPTHTIVVDDCDLEPLDDDDDDIRELVFIERPMAKGSRLIEFGT